jgi:hypothetical protein
MTVWSSLGLADDGVVIFKPRKMTVWSSLGLADDWLPVVAGDVVELDSVLVEVVEDAQAPLVPLPVVRLWAPSSEIIQPFLKGQFHKIILNRKGARFTFYSF